MNDYIHIKGTPFVIERTYPFRIAWINDIHVGAQYGLWPSDFETTRGHFIGRNEGQEILSKYFEEFAETCKENAVTILAMPGDLLTGQNRKELGNYTMTTDLEEQKRACAHVIADFCDRVGTIKEIWIWKGTPYHASMDTSVEESVAAKLRDMGYNATYFGEYSIITLKHKEFEKRLFVTHPASDSFMYPEQAMGKEMMLWQEGVANGKLPRIDMMFRAHKHFFTEVHKPQIRAIQLPCWQYFVPYDKAMKNFAKFQPDIGGVVTLFDDKLRATVWHFLFQNILDPRAYLTVAENPKEIKKVALC